MTGKTKGEGPFVFISEVVKGEAASSSEIDLGPNVVCPYNHDHRILGRDRRFRVSDIIPVVHAGGRHTLLAAIGRIGS